MPDADYSQAQDYFGIAPRASVADYFQPDAAYAYGQPAAPVVDQTNNPNEDIYDDPYAELAGHDPDYDRAAARKQIQHRQNLYNLQNNIDPTTDEGTSALMKIIGNDPRLLQHPEIKQLLQVSTAAQTQRALQENREDVNERRAANADTRNTLKQQQFELQQQKAKDAQNAIQQRREATKSLMAFAQLDPNSDTYQDDRAAAIQAAQDAGADQDPHVMQAIIQHAGIRKDRAQRGIQLPTAELEKLIPLHVAANTPPLPDEVNSDVDILGRTPRTPREKAQVATALQTQRIHAFNARLAAAQANQNGGFSPIPITTQPPQQQSPVISSQSAFNALPSGAKFVAADGKTYTKK